MGLADVVRNAVAVAYAVTEDLQTTVGHYVRSGQDKYNKPTYAAVVNRAAIVERRQKMISTKDGDTLLSQARIMFPYPVTIVKEDKLVLPDGTTGPILSISGVIDGDTGAPYYADIELGKDTGGGGF